MKAHRGITILLFLLMLGGCKNKPPVVNTAPPPVVAPPPAPLPTIRITATPGSVERGSSVTLQWEARNAGSVRIEPEVGEVATNGTRQVSPSSSVTYQATAIGPGGTAQDVARVVVTLPPPPTERVPEARVTPPDATLENLFGQNMQTILFDYDKSEIRSDQIPKLQNAMAWLRSNPNVRFVIEGHCDEKGSQEYNLGLGDRRANAVKEYFLQQGIQESRMNAISYGEERPECREESESCMARNRRAAFTLNP